MPEMNGFELHERLVINGLQIPTILITAHGDAALRGFGEDDLLASLRKPVQEEAFACSPPSTEWRRLLAKRVTDFPK
jgi:FixJ family two-component response regulator